MQAFNVGIEIRDQIFGGETVLSGLAWSLGFAALTALGAQVDIPTEPVPFTLQTFFVMMAGALLGSRKGALSMAIYLCLGIIGMPVFASGGFGIARLVGPTGGYLLAFPVAAWIIGWMVGRGSSFGWTLLSLLLGLLVIFSLGTIQLNLILIRNWPRAFEAGFLIFTWWDVLKVVAVASIYKQMRARLGR